MALTKEQKIAYLQKMIDLAPFEGNEDKIDFYKKVKEDLETGKI